MNDPKFEVGQQVEATWHGLFTAPDYKPAHITGSKYVYTVKFNDQPEAGSYQRDEDQIRLPRPSVEEAWEKATMLIGIRAHEKGEYCCLDHPEKLVFDKETRHQVYQILGSATIRITDEVKADVRRLIGIADDM
jgi:hypothetical protein